ncbi:uncharacterized protein Z520_12254 [Fonsecaea multimorphosa CBS 102226]|uniref:F-box domain-containing protein n=1 Tax=Fonsecaea multimorphosa CBS 102226 TaxID=1442371 RepID=A0A0D2K6P5_9EURO|nr:uncharacterized protein Z520_12254 [Fonsecaea multimorphosa CBS 102226]KIX92038.1 hypothetical protein Z520_12254 [Fonsecaea multimorphosa CBS 102226]OAL17406.1 hypothetical protein AYO22_11687 [Fonsecaea multimorphosa]
MGSLLSFFNPRLSSQKRRQPCLDLVPENFSSPLTSLPTELLLIIASSLPPSALACLMLTSKHFYNTLAYEFDPRMQHHPEEKALFVRLLEKDLPHMLACYSCDILFDWRKKPRCRCPNHHNHLFLTFDPLWCYVHSPALISREMVDAFVRGYEKGPEYGPQLEELTHKCKRDGGWYPTRGKKVARRLDARVQQGRLIVHGVYSMRVPLPPHCIKPSPDYVDRSFELSLTREMAKFAGIGCVHLGHSLPAILLDSVRRLPGLFEQRPLCHDLINCGFCATDLRVRTVVGEDAHLTLQVEMWRSFGGRDPAMRDPLEDAHFQFPGNRLVAVDLNEPPTRNLEELFNGETRRRLDFRMLQAPPNRQTWLQVWMWAYSEHTASLWADLIRDGCSAMAVRAARPRRSRNCFGLQESAKAIIGAMKRRLRELNDPYLACFSIQPSNALGSTLQSIDSTSPIQAEIFIPHYRYDQGSEPTS